MIFLLFLLAGSGVIARLFYLQILEHRTYLQAAVRQQGDETVSRRGTIYFQDKNGQLQAAAINKELFTLSVSLKEIADPDDTARRLSAILGLTAETIAKKLKGTASYVVIQRKLDDDMVRTLRLADIPGVYLQGESRRVYPSGVLAANVLGYASPGAEGERGTYGIERLFDNDLRGETSILDGAGSAGSILSLGKRIVNPPQNGKDVVLTIDFNIQRQAEAALESVMKKWTPEQGMISVVDPSTGRILAMATRPTFDPNNYGKAENIAHFLNPLVESSFELGSVMKPITMAAGINEGAVKPDTTYTDSGIIRIGGYKIQNYDHQAHGVMTMTNVLEKSLNTGAVFVAEKLGHSRFQSYLKAFGFGERTGIDLPGEVRGNISNLDQNQEIELATASFGQGVAVTPIQMMMAASAVANGGTLVRPYIVDRKVDDAGVEEATSAETKRRVVRSETSETLAKMLVSVTRNGFDNHAGVKGFFIAGKTGTAQIPNPKARGYSSDVIHSFIGYAPAFKPRFLIYLQLVRPKGVNFASTSLTPAFHEVASYILNYYGVPPDER